MKNSFAVKLMIYELQFQRIKKRLHCNTKVLIVMREAGDHGGTEKHESMKNACSWLNVRGSLSKGVNHIAGTWKP